MNWLDLIIVILWFGALSRGLELGFVRQLGSTAGFFIGLFIGAAVGTYFLKDTGFGAVTRVGLSFFLTFGTAIALSTGGELVGTRLKQRLSRLVGVDKIDRVLGAALGAVTLLVGVWLSASFFGNMPSPTVQRQFATSSIVSQLNRLLPPAPGVIAKLGGIIEPNGFPEVFTGLEPKVDTTEPLPSIGELDDAVQQTRASVVKLEGRGCGGWVDGSGFVAGKGVVITNAHVVAGVSDLEVVDGDGSHKGTVVWFDENLDMAVVRADTNATPLTMRGQKVSDGTSAAVLGYPGGGNFTADPAVVLNSFMAVGRNIYNTGETKREVYSLKANVEPGNSGGPLIAKDGSVIGLIFAESTTYDDVGYALTMHQVMNGFEQARDRTQPVGTGSCAER